MITQPENGGPSIARNTAFKQACGRYLAILDADDSFAPGRLKSLVETADASHADLIVDNLVRVNAQMDRIDGGRFLTAPLYSMLHHIGLAAYVAQNNLMARLPALGYLKPLFSREFIENHQLAYDTSLRNSEDYYLVADMLALGAHMVFAPVEGYFYRVDAGSISHRLTPDLTRALLSAEDAFLARHAGKFDKFEKKALRRRKRRLKHVHAFVVLVEKLKSRRLTSALAVVAKYPGAWGFISSQFSQIVLQKLSKRAPV